MAELSDRELDGALAVAALEWRACLLVCAVDVSTNGGQWHPDGRTVGSHVHDDQNRVRTAPTYSTSIDALQAVEGRLREAGVWLEVIAYADGAVQATWRSADTDLLVSGGTLHSTEARARAEAALLALRAIEVTSITTLASRTEAEA